MRSRKLIALCLTLLVLPFLLISCGKTLTESASGIKDSTTKINYNHASVTYEPVELGKKYGTLKVGEKVSLALYRIEGLDPTEWLATEDMNVLYADSVTLPSLADMEPTGLQICAKDVSVHVLRRIGDAEVVRAVTSAWTDNDSLTYPSRMPQKVYKLRFESELYPSLYYCVTYIEYSSDLELDGVNYGKYFLYSAFDDIFVPMGDAIHRIITHDGTDTEGTAS